MITRRHMYPRTLVPLVASVSFLVLAGCEGSTFENPFKAKDSLSETAPLGPVTGDVTERDVEAPEVFSVSEPGLWDGRPSLGGVWVAHPDVVDAGRVIIRNTKNDKFVIGALFRRERDNPGPALQVSSDAAEALDILAGAPTAMSVIALRREAVPVAPAPTEPVIAEETLENVPDAPAIEATPLDPIAETASAAIAAAEATPAPAPTPAAVAAPKPQASSLSKPFIQLGIFSVEANARNTATAMRQIGVVPTVRKQSSKGKTFWRVVVGPATTSSERAALLKKIKAQGFEDAYFVTN
ncbi:SPOR domain-containing protein [Algirhabdus cladophorae]|uniref:SPOR domain-containing protein n=1 Tax=Algirhabdus cladophorae TaxID=3377108 RepID=UPI003B847549